MGMAASQARLLSITARIHDVEYQAQSIQNAKVQLATQSDRVYQEYVDALDAESLTLNVINNGATSLIVANFNNMFSKNKATPADGTNYALRNKRGQLVVDNDIYEGYKEFKDTGFEKTAYAFALHMLDIQNITDPNLYRNAEMCVYEKFKDEENCSTANALFEKMEKIFQKIRPGEELTIEDVYSSEIFNSINTNLTEDELNKLRKEFDETRDAFLNALYTSYGNEIVSIANGTISSDSDKTHEDLVNGNFSYNDIDTSDMSPEDVNLEDFNYYMSIYKQIEACGGCISIDEYDGPNGDAANNSEWLQNMIRSGQLFVDIVEDDKETGKVKLATTSPSSDGCLSYSPTSSIDKSALAKAEAKYEHDLKEIEKKDKQFDLSLSKLEAERTALTTQYDSLKKVVEDNIERTFGIFS